jgi:HSP20 family protein
MMMVTKWQPRYSTMKAWDPFAELAGFRRFFDQPLTEGSTQPFSLVGTDGEWRPLMDVFETKDSVVVKLEVPGIKQEDVQISVEDNTLTVSGERKHEAEVNEEGYHRMERAHGSFQRSVLLPPTVDADRAKATYQNGVLEIQLPKKEEAKPKTIKVEAA